jgi:hypothetical protein
VQRTETDDGVYKIGQIENPTVCGYRGKTRMPFSSSAGIFAVSEYFHLHS